MRKVDPIGQGRCPEGYEFVHGYKDKSGTYVRPFCRKIRKVSVKLKMTMNYPGETVIKGSVRKGIHKDSATWKGSTEDIMNGNKELKDAMMDNDTE